MFKIEDNQLVWGDSRYLLPEEVANKQPELIYGTSTAGLLAKYGLLIFKNGASGTALCGPSETISGHIVDDNCEIGDYVFLREQIDTENTNKYVWLISSQEIKNQVNWINVQFKDKTILRLCPFTKHYKVINA